MSEPYRFVERAPGAVGGRPPVRPRRVSGSDAAFRGGSRPSEMRASPARARVAAGRTTRHCSEDGPDLTQGVAHGPLVARQYPGARRQYPAASCVSRRAIRVSSPWLTGRQYMRQYPAAPGPTLVVAPSESVSLGSLAVSTPHVRMCQRAGGPFSSAAG
jgi:hypothetical protein